MREYLTSDGRIYHEEWKRDVMNRRIARCEAEGHLARRDGTCVWCQRRLDAHSPVRRYRVTD